MTTTVNKTRKTFVSFRFVKDNDGFITIKEFREFHAKRNNDETAIAKAFAAIDSDKDGRVTLEGSFGFLLIIFFRIVHLEFIRAYEALE